MEAYALTTTGERMAQVATGSKPMDTVDGAPGRLLRIEEVADRLVALEDDAAGVRAGRARALDAYRRNFSKRLVNDKWAALLDSQLRPAP